MKSLVIVIGLGLTLPLAACSNNDRHEAKLRDAIARATVSLRDAAAIAEGAMPGGGAVAVSARLRVDTEPVYAVNAVATGALTDVRVAPVGGTVLGTAAAGSWSGTDCPGAISLAETIAIAEAAVHGTAVSIAPDDDGACNREVQVLTASDLWEVKVGPSGAVVETEVSDETED